MFKFCFILLFLVSFTDAQDVEGCMDFNALNCANNPPTMEENEFLDWWNHCATCPEIPCVGFYNPNATLEDNSCQYNQVPSWDEMIIEASPGQIFIDWSLFSPPVEEINGFVIQRCSGDGSCYFVENASNTDTYQETNIIDYYDWTPGENINYYMGVLYPNNTWWSQAKGTYNFFLGCTDENSSNYNPDALVDDGSCSNIDILIGDVNFDNLLNILDLVLIVNFIIDDLNFNESQISSADYNFDGNIDILDIVQIVNCILIECWSNSEICQDFDGNIYETTQIGEQVWMTENLKTTHYNNGDEIIFINSSDLWDSYDTGHYAAYNNDLSNVNLYGYLYNWTASTDPRGVCPEGYHVPSDEEWSELILYLDSSTNPFAENHDEIHSSFAGGFLKSTGTVEAQDGLWISPNTGANNDSGFSAFPAGLTNDEAGNNDLMGYYLGYLAWFWTSTEIDFDQAWSRELFWVGSDIHRHSITKNYGISIRCISD